MSTAIAGVLRPVPIPSSSVLRRDPAAQAFMLLRVAFTVAPILFGLDKFAEVMISDWPKYLAPEFNDLIPGSTQDAGSGEVLRRETPECVVVPIPAGGAENAEAGGQPTFCARR
jgi:hypothetical protein